MPKRSLTGRRAPAPPRLRKTILVGVRRNHPRGALPAFLPARVVADLWVEPDARTFGLEHPFVGGVVLRVMQRRSRAGGRWRCASGTIAPKKGSSPGRWRSTRRLVLLHPATDVVKPAHGDVQEPKGPLVVHVDVLHVTDEAGLGVEDPSGGVRVGGDAGAG